MLIHVCLVSDQTLANLIPALMDRPDKVCLVATDSMLRKGLPRRLSAILERKGIRTETIEGAPDAGIGAILEFAGRAAARITQREPSARLVLNATGGTKLMALGFTEALRNRAERIIYTDTSHRRIECLPAAGGALGDTLPMRDVLDVNTYLSAQGFDIERSRSDEESWLRTARVRRAVCEYLAVRLADRDVQNLVGALNGLAHQALDEDGRLVAPRQELEDEPRSPWPEILRRLQDFGLVRFQGRTIEFLDVSGARFLHGDWLEEYAWHVVADAKPFDVRLGVEGRWSDARSARNEFDVLATHMNELLFVECKTLRHGREDARDADLLYKVDSLGQDVRGLFGTTWLVTARTPAPEMIGRAHQQGVTLLGPAEVARLAGHVRNWMSRAAPSR